MTSNYFSAWHKANGFQTNGENDIWVPDEDTKTRIRYIWDGTGQQKMSNALIN